MKAIVITLAGVRHECELVYQGPIMVGKRRVVPAYYCARGDCPPIGQVRSVEKR